MRWLCILSLTCSLLACGGEPEPSVEPEPEPTPEPAPEPVAPPTLEALPVPTAGEARAAVPELGDGFEYPVQTLQAGFGRDENLIMLEMKPPGDEGLSIQLTFHGTEPMAAGGYRVLPVVDEPNAVTAALGRTRLRPAAGELQVESVSNDAIVATLDLEVRHPLNPEPARLRARIHARHDAYYDAAIGHERAIREQLKKRR